LAEFSFEWDAVFSKSKEEIAKVTLEYRQTVEKALQDLAEGHSQLSQAANTALSAGGKRLRPILALLCCEAISDTYDKAVPAAISYELAHAASLVQDDIIDDSPLRHNKPNPYSKFGTVRAVMVSDYLIFTIFSELSKYGEIDLPKERYAMLLSYFADAAKTTVKGEFSDVLLATKGGVTREEYLDMIGFKTGALFAACAATGGIIGGASRRVINSMYRFGHHFGLAFQIMDDIMDIVGNSSLTGKPALKDLENNASNIVVIHSLSKLNAKEKKTISSLRWRENIPDSSVKKVVSMFEKTGSLEYAMNLASRYNAICRICLRSLPSSRAREKLDRLARALIAWPMNG
jgi:geranylgeranyl pyrophosphate synthase